MALGSDGGFGASSPRALIPTMFFTTVVMVASKLFATHQRDLDAVEPRCLHAQQEDKIPNTPEMVKAHGAHHYSSGSKERHPWSKSLLWPKYVVVVDLFVLCL